jgi:hypothetical protein
MKGDFTRNTFDRTKHYRSVRMQQGRVQLDADWNEQMDIASDRIETEALDLIGPSGGPLHHDGFHLVAALAALSADEQARPENQSPPVLAPVAPKGDFYISGGRYYVDGILCQNEHIVPFTQQPDLPDTKPLSQSGVYVAYLDVWPRHVNALDDPLLREVALGGPDTGTRAKNIAQVKLLRVGNAGANFNCLSAAADWNALIAPSSARLRARTQPSAVSNNPCIIEPGAGYRRLENQLYRVEIHKAGPVGTATFKWSRDNGSIVTSWLGQNVAELTVGNIGRDAVLRFSGGQWVELTDDTHELNGRPGTLVRLIKAEGQVLTIDSTTAIPPGPIALADFPLNPRVRRWDSATGVDPVTIPGGGSGGYLALEDGIEIRFQAGAIHNTGDYWLIPARTATGDIEWPGPSNAPLSLLPHGIQHHYCRLAVLDFNGTTFTKVTDCRELFPPLTELTSFFYLSGDGQEATPDPAQPAALLALAQPLRVGVANGEWPVAGARVQFKILLGTGQVQGAASSTVVLTGNDGVATCPWKLDSTTQGQQVEARLLNAANNSTHLPVRFNANLSTAAAVSYDPKNCANLAGSKTVQEALDILCKLDHGGSCCCVTVGKGGDFQLLDAAVKELLKTKTDICICLMPGEHKLPDGLEIKANSKMPVHLRIAGCGRGSRIILSNKSIQATGLASFTLRDLCLFAVDKAGSKPIGVSECLEVSITGCHLKQEIASTDLLTIGGATRVDISDNVIESWAVTGERLASMADIFNVKVAARAEAGPTYAYQELPQQFARMLGSVTDKKRTTVLNQFRKFADKAPATEFRNAANQAIKEMGDLKFQTEIRGDSIGQLAAGLARLITAPAVVIADAKAETSITDNIIIGEVRFYGAKSSISQKEFEKIIGSVIKPGKLPKAKNQERTVRIEGNSLTQVVADVALTKQAKASNGLFGRMSFLDNTFHAPGNQWMARHVISNGNNFALLDDATVGTAAGATFICLGTTADVLPSKLRFAVPTAAAFRESANLIKLVPV